MKFWTFQYCFQNIDALHLPFTSIFSYYTVEFTIIEEGFTPQLRGEHLVVVYCFNKCFATLRGSLVKLFTVYSQSLFVHALFNFTPFLLL